MSHLPLSTGPTRTLRTRPGHRLQTYGGSLRHLQRTTAAALAGGSGWFSWLVLQRRVCDRRLVATHGIVADLARPSPSGVMIYAQQATSAPKVVVAILAWHAIIGKDREGPRGSKAGWEAPARMFSVLETLLRAVPDRRPTTRAWLTESMVSSRQTAFSRAHRGPDRARPTA